MDKIELEKAKEQKIAKILDYDKSEGVNSFALNGNLAWLDKDTRVGLVNSLQIEKAAGRVSTELWLNGVMYSLPIDHVLQMLVVLELYAKDCYNVTQQHISNVKMLDDLNRVWNYDYTKGYPKRPVFEV
jgi:hypothetical protein